MDLPTSSLDKLAAAIQVTPKYRHLTPDLIRRLGERELAVRGSFKEAVKATKNKLHQVAGAYQESKINYDRALAQLRKTVGDAAAFQHTCTQLLRLHTSTAERLPILDEFYRTTLADLPPIHKVLDLACGLNPLTLPWMPFSPEVEYVAYDVYTDMMAFLGEFMGLAGVRGRAEPRDLLTPPPNEPADLVLLLKTLPCLEQTDKHAAATILDALQAPYLLISFPAHSLGGRDKGMATHYTDQFIPLIQQRGWQITPFTFATEIAFLVKKV
ncbi:MAG: 16S rRNA methyltransferase [Anaerolineae bacterium]|nr:16S rRNA methyltransferase [Anaerolineae bacterium]